MFSSSMKHIIWLRNVKIGMHAHWLWCENLCQAYRVPILLLLIEMCHIYIATHSFQPNVWHYISPIFPIRLAWLYLLRVLYHAHHSSVNLQYFVFPCKFGKLWPCMQQNPNHEHIWNVYEHIWTYMKLGWIHSISSLVQNNCHYKFPSPAP